MATRVKMSPEEVKAIKDALAQRSPSTDQGRSSANGATKPSSQHSASKRATGDKPNH